MIYKRTLSNWLKLISYTVAGLAITVMMSFSGHSYAQAVPPPDATNYNFYCGFTIMGRQGCNSIFSNVNYYSNSSNSSVAPVPQDFVLTSYPGTANAFPDNMADPKTFEAILENYLSKTNNGTVYDYNGVGAAFIIDAMLGANGANLCGSGSCTWQDAVNYAYANLPTFFQRVNYYALHGWIGWQDSVTYPAGTPISGHVCGADATASLVCSTAAASGRTDQSDIKDFAFAGLGQVETYTSIVFHNPDGSTIEINRLCGNLIGNLNPLADVGEPLNPPPAVPICDQAIIDPANVDPSTKFTVTADVTFASHADAQAAVDAEDLMQIFYTYPGGKVDVSPFLPISSPPGSPNVYAASTSFGPTNLTGNARVDYLLFDFQGSPIMEPCQQYINIGNNIADFPYFSVPNGDIQTGAPMGITDPAGGTDCTTVPADPKAGIVSWNQEAAGNYAGAGTGYAAIALGYLQDFASSQGGSAGSAIPPIGLSFSNTNFAATGGQNVSTIGNGNDTYGGNFGLLSCMPNFTANLGAPQPKGTPAPPADPNGRVTFYVNGNVHLIDDVAIFNGTYTDLSKIPSYTIITTGGNIYIQGWVSRLDGLYIAEPDSNGKGGTIYTCTYVPSAAVQNGDTNLTVDLQNYYDACNTQLTVNGAFVAKKIVLLRTGGSLHESFGAAETFNFAPELWLGMPYDGVDGALGRGYDSITSLPPVL